MASQTGLSTDPQWTIRRAGRDDRDALLALLGRAFGRNAPSLEWWNWAFVENPAASELVSLVAEVGNRLVGQWAALPIRLQHRQKTIVALRGVWNATDPDYRRRGILTALGRRLDQEFGEEFGLSIGFTNQSSRPVLTKLGSVVVGPYPRLIRPVGGLAREAGAWRRWASPAGAAGQLAFSGLAALNRIPTALGKIGGRRIEDFEDFGSWADELWGELSPQLGTCVVRDSAYLNWRFRAAPFEYRRVALAGPAGAEGFAVTTTTQARGDRVVVTLSELLARPGDHQGARMLIDHVVREARRERAAGIVTLATVRHPFRRELILAGFLPLPWPRSEDTFNVRILGRGRDVTPNDVLHVDDWYLSGADRTER